MKVVIATTTMYREPSLRARLAVEMVAKASNQGHEIVIVDGGSYPGFWAAAASQRTHFVAEVPGLTMAAGRRLAVSRAMELASPDGIVLWTEPEKVDLVRSIPEIALAFTWEKADLIVPMRSAQSWRTYPPEQGFSEGVINQAFNYCSGKMAWDVTFGPFAMNAKSCELYMQYADEFGGKWESHQVLFLRALARNLKVAPLREIDFNYPAEQCESEEGKEAMFMKRLEQARVIIPAMYRMAERLQLLKV